MVPTWSSKFCTATETARKDLINGGRTREGVQLLLLPAAIRNTSKFPGAVVLSGSIGMPAGICASAGWGGSMEFS